jgi:hypothetical protein
MYVPIGTLRQYGCWPDGTSIFPCTRAENGGACYSNPVYPEAYPTVNESPVDIVLGTSGYVGASAG